MEYALNDDNKRRRAKRHYVSSTAASHTDTGGSPNTSRRRKPFDFVLFIDNHTCAEETDTRDDLRRNTPGVAVADITGNDGHKRRANANYRMRTDTRLFETLFSFKADGKT